MSPKPRKATFQDFEVLVVDPVGSLTRKLPERKTINYTVVTKKEKAEQEVFLQSNQHFDLILINNDAPLFDFEEDHAPEDRILALRTKVVSATYEDRRSLRRSLRRKLDEGNSYFNPDIITKELPAKPKVLIVDSSEKNCKMFEELLNREGYQTVSTISGYEGLELIESDDLDIALIDQSLRGGLQGITIVERIKKLTEKEPLPTILTGGTLDDELMKALKQHETFDFLSTPVASEKVLYKTVERALARSARMNLEQIAQDRRILVIDPHFNYGVAIQRLLMEEGVKYTYLAQDLSQGIDIMEEESIDMVIADLMHEGESFLDIFYSLSDYGERRVKTVVMSGKKEPTTIDDLMKKSKEETEEEKATVSKAALKSFVQVGRFMRKPFSRTELINTAASIFSAEEIMTEAGAYKPLPEEYSGNLIVVTGPYASGKTFLARKLIRNIESLEFLMRTTDREKREGEVEGESGLIFKSLEEMETLREEGVLIKGYEHANNNYYIPREIDFSGRDLIVTPDNTGFNFLRNRFENSYAVCVFSSADDLQARMELRSASEEEKHKRMEVLGRKMRFYRRHFPGEQNDLPKFDLVIYNPNPMQRPWYADETFFSTLDLQFEKIASYILDVRRQKIKSMNL